MKIISPDFEVLSLVDGRAILHNIERCGRVCYKSEDKITETSAQAFVGNIIQRGHEAVLEHASVTVKFTVDRGVSHEIVRHTARRAPATATIPRTVLAVKSPLSSLFTWRRAPGPLPVGVGPVKRRKAPISPCWSGAVPRKRPVPFCPTASRRRW